jgi:hypothetical protein
MWGVVMDFSITLPPEMHCGNTPESLILAIYPAIEDPSHIDQYFLEHTILSGWNDDVDELNASILSEFPGEESILWSAHKVDMEHVQANEAHL